MERRRLLFVLGGIGAVIVVIIAAIVLTSGGGGSSGGSSSSNSPGANLPKRVQGELRLFGDDPITLDPACASDVSSANYIVELFSGLVTFGKDLKVAPDIAQSWDISPDKKTYTFHLRPNVMFQDSSRRVTANDFKFSMERALDPKTQSTVGEVYLDDIAGVDAFVKGKANHVSGIKAVDDNTLELDINQPTVVFLEKLTYPTAFVVDQRQVQDSTCFSGNWTQHPNGTGPFRLKDWTLGQTIELSPNPNFYLDPKPSLSQVTYVLSGGSPLTMYENNEIDITGVGANDIQRVRDPSDPLNKDYHQTTALDLFYIGFNMKKPPFNNPKVRQALSLAIDRDTVANQVLEGLVVPATGILPPGIPGARENSKTLQFDAARAKQLLQEAGGPDLLKGVKLLTSGQGAAPSQVLDAITAMWKQNLGVTINTEQEEAGLFFRDTQEGNFDMASIGWIADYPDPQNFLEIKLYSKSKNNDNFYSNPNFDKLIETARAETDDAKRIQDYQQAEDVALQDLPWVPLFFDKDNYLVKPYVSGYAAPPFVIPTLRYVSVQR